MEKIKLQVSGSQIQVVQRPAAITAGTVGLEAEFSFDSHWNNLGKTVIFQAGDKVITAALESDTHIVPWEVLEKPDLWLTVGVYGANPEGTVVIPTLWTKVAAVYTGVDPEGDPALEPSNPIWQQTLARVANMEPQLSEHIGNTENPHGVNCDQIGAVTQKEFRDVVSNLDGSSDPDGLIPHLLNRDNPHGVTVAQIGAAPAGFGYGGEQLPVVEGANTNEINSGITELIRAMPPIFCTRQFKCKNPVTGGGHLYGTIYKQNDTNAVVVLHQLSYRYELRGQYTQGVWQEWEWSNPPMDLNMEYRTTEKFNGKPVYAKLLNCGALPNATNKQVFVANNISNIVRTEGYLENTAGYLLQAPTSGTSAVSFYLYNNTNLRIATTSDQSTWNAYVAVYYTLGE